jgi:hypothetical protein
VTEPSRPARAPDLTVDEFGRRDRRPRLRRPHQALIIALIVIAMIAAILVFAHRSSPCHVQITRINGTAADTEQCINQ